MAYIYRQPDGTELYVPSSKLNHVKHLEGSIRRAEHDEIFLDIDKISSLEELKKSKQPAKPAPYKKRRRIKKIPKSDS